MSQEGDAVEDGEVVCEPAVEGVGNVDVASDLDDAVCAVQDGDCDGPGVVGCVDRGDLEQLGRASLAKVVCELGGGPILLEIA